MENFIGWLKFYFLGFFSNELSQEGASRSFWNVLLSFFLSFVIICGGLVAGYVAAFDVHYNNAEEFRGFLYSVFADGVDGKNIKLSVSGNRLSAELPDGKQCINGVAEKDGAYNINGYKLILDTRPAGSTFDDFVLTCKNAEGNAVAYEDYKAMSEEDKKAISITITYSGKAVDTLARQADNTAYLEKASQSGAPEYNKETADAYSELKGKAGELGAKEYADEIYKLYVKAYYPLLAGRDAYGGAPTLRTYYMNSSMYAGLDKYIILLDDVCVCTFKTDGGIIVDYAGNFNNTADGVISADGLSAEQMRANIDGMIKSTFDSAGALTLFVYVVSLFKILPLFAVIMVFLALVCFLVYKVKKLEFYGKFAGMFKVASSFLLISSLLTFIVALVSSFFLPRGTVYTVACAVLVAVVAVRMAVLLIMELVKAKKQAKPEEETEAV